MKAADETVSTFNAGASMLGYPYQVRVAAVGLADGKSDPHAQLV